MNKTKIEWTDFSASPIKYRDTEGRVAWGCVKAQRWDYRPSDRKGGDMSELPEDLRVREMPR